MLHVLYIQRKKLPENQTRNLEFCSSSFFLSFLPSFIIFLSFSFFHSFSLSITRKLYSACVLIFYQTTALLMEINSTRTCFELHPCELHLASYAYKTISKEALQSRSRTFLYEYSRHSTCSQTTPGLLTA